jgi:transcriptional regulator with XRE-family HTH domain
MPARIGNPAKRRRTFIKEWREFRDNMSQERLAELIGGTKASVSRVESGKAGYTQDFLEAVADALGCHVSDLLTRMPTEADRKVVALSRRRARR